MDACIIRFYLAIVTAVAFLILTPSPFQETRLRINVKLLQIEIIKYSDYFASGDYQQEFDKDEILEELQIVIDEFFQ